MIYYRLELRVLGDALGYASIQERTDDNAGYDCYCAEELDLTSGDSLVSTGAPTLLPLGVQARMVRINDETGEETDVHYWLSPRSSIFKKGLVMANSMGVIDKTYRGELKAPVFLHHAFEPRLLDVHPKGAEFRANFQTWGKVAKGERLFQILAPDMGWIREVRIVDSLSSTARGAGGFGSSGTH
jgi:dUTPase